MRLKTSYLTWTFDIFQNWLLLFRKECIERKKKQKKRFIIPLNSFKFHFVSKHTETAGSGQ